MGLGYEKRTTTPTAFLSTDGGSLGPCPIQTSAHDMRKELRLRKLKPMKEHV
jgi:hypothetical protein